MPNMTATQLLKAITKASNTLFEEAELRTYQHSLVGKLIGNENQVFRNVNQLKQSLEQPTKAILFNRQYVASGTAKEANHTGLNADTFENDIAYIIRKQDFQVSYKRAANNQFDYQEILRNNLKQAVINLYEDISAYAVSWLATNRSQVGVNSLIAFDPVTDYEFDNPLADKDFFFEHLVAAMKTNKYRGMMDVVGDQRTTKEYRRLGNQGAGNSTNLAYQIPGLDYVDEPQIALQTDGYAYAWMKGLVGMTSWNETLNRQGHGDPGDNEGFFTTMQDPVFGLLHDVHIKNDIADTSGAAGNPQDVVEEYEISTIFTIQGAWESTANASPIFRFKQLAA